MSVFIIKLIAIIAMLIDHLGFTAMATVNTDMPAETMRIIGRIAFPLFAFLLINGWKYTRDKRSYFKNMLIFAVVSHIPFTLAIGNFTEFKRIIISRVEFSKLDFNINLRNFDSLGFIIVMISAYIYFIWKDKKDWTIIPAVIAVILPFFTMYGDKEVFISLPILNIFYTFLLGMIIIVSIEKVVDLVKRKTEKEQSELYSELCSDEAVATENSIYNSQEYYEEIEEVDEDSVLGLDSIESSKKFGTVETLFLVLITIFAVYILYDKVDYGRYGLLLITGLFITRKQRMSQVIFILFWSAVYYYLEAQKLEYVAAASLSVLPIIFYNEKKGPGLKYMFYAFYPVHLLILGIYSCYTMFWSTY